MLCALKSSCTYSYITNLQSLFLSSSIETYTKYLGCTGPLDNYFLFKVQYREALKWEPINVINSEHENEF